jgi:hypothetical protein
MASPMNEKLSQLIERLKSHATIVDHSAMAVELLRAQKHREGGLGISLPTTP